MKPLNPALNTATSERSAASGRRLPIVELFASMQGEGYNTGMQVTFVRLGQCNLACAWCDTDYHSYQWRTVPEVVAQVLALNQKRVVVTGGEPLLQPLLPELLVALKAHNLWLALETNGLVLPSAAVLPLLDYIAVSPKVAYADLYAAGTHLQQADEVRIVVDGPGTRTFCQYMRAAISARHYYLSPCEISQRMNIQETVALLGELNQALTHDKWGLSLQTHKLGGFA